MVLVFDNFSKRQETLSKIKKKYMAISNNMCFFSIKLNIGFLVLLKNRFEIFTCRFYFITCSIYKYRWETFSIQLNFKIRSRYVYDRFNPGSSCNYHRQDMYRFSVWPVHLQSRTNIH